MDERERSVAKARHETANGRLKQFGALSNIYCHNVKNHGQVLMAIANIVQIQIEEECPLFQVEYYQP